MNHGWISDCLRRYRRLRRRRPLGAPVSIRVSLSLVRLLNRRACGTGPAFVSASGIPLPPTPARCPSTRADRRPRRLHWETRKAESCLAGPKGLAAFLAQVGDGAGLWSDFYSSWDVSLWHVLMPPPTAADCCSRHGLQTGGPVISRWLDIYAQEGQTNLKGNRTQHIWTPVFKTTSDGGFVTSAPINASGRRSRTNVLGSSSHN